MTPVRRSQSWSLGPMWAWSPPGTHSQRHIHSYPPTPTKMDNLVISAYYRESVSLVSLALGTRAPRPQPLAPSLRNQAPGEGWRSNPTHCCNRGTALEMRVPKGGSCPHLGWLEKEGFLGPYLGWVLEDKPGCQPRASWHEQRH